MDIPADAFFDSEVNTACPLPFPLNFVHIVRQRENAESAVNANQSRRAPKPGGAVQRNRSLLRRPRKTNPVQRGRQDQPITKPIMTASHIGTAHSKMSTNVSVIEGFLRNSTRSKKGSSIFPGKHFPWKIGRAMEKSFSALLSKRTPNATTWIWILSIDS